MRFRFWQDKPAPAPAPRPLRELLEECPDDWRLCAERWVYVSQCHCGALFSDKDDVHPTGPFTCPKCGCRNLWEKVVGRFEWESSRARWDCAVNYTHTFGPIRYYEEVSTRNRRFVLRSLCQHQELR